MLPKLSMKKKLREIAKILHSSYSYQKNEQNPQVSALDYRVREGLFVPEVGDVLSTMGGMFRGPHVSETGKGLRFLSLGSQSHSDQVQSALCAVRRSPPAQRAQREQQDHRRTQRGPCPGSTAYSPVRLLQLIHRKDSVRCSLCQPVRALVSRGVQRPRLQKALTGTAYTLLCSSKTPTPFFLSPGLGLILPSFHK